MTHLDLAVLCNKAYDDSPEILSVRETDAIVKRYKDRTVIGFRGTSSNMDTVRNLRFWKYRTVLGWRAHKGFALGAEQWFKMYSKTIDTSKPVVLTGHSQGAAIATQSVPLFRSAGFKVQECVVFGEPASLYSGDEYLYQRLNIPSTSYLNANDWIRKTPPWGETGVPRTYLDKKGWVSLKAHSIKEYIKALSTLALVPKEPPSA